jgi:predicted dehydrogenase
MFKKVDGTIKKIKLATENKNPLKQELKSFIHCIRTGETPIVSGEQGRRALQVALQILENIKTTK